MRDYRPHRFPPLSHYVRRGPPGAGGGSGSGGEWQSSLSDGFQRGMNEGYGEGHATGLANGREQGMQEGREEGRREGLEAGRREALAAFEGLAKPMDAMVKAFKRLQTDYQQAQRKEVVDLVAKVARQVIRAELALQPVQLLTLVDETLAAMPATREETEVYLNPEELARIKELDPKRAKRWVLIADAKLSAGECRVKSGDHEADAGCQQRLAACMEQVSSRLLEGADAKGAAA